MASLSITTAWNETADFVRREGGLLFPISFLLLSLPNALMEALTPAPLLPGQAPEPGLWLLFFPIVIVAGLVGNIAISFLALQPGSSVGEALRRGGARMPALLGAVALFGLAFVILFFILAIIAVMLVPGAIGAAEAGVPSPAVMLAVVLVIVAVLPVALYFGARLIAMTPVSAAEPGGPLSLLRRSWALTAGHVWKLIAFLLLVGILVTVLTAAIRTVTGIVFALVAGPLEPGSTSAWLVIVVMSLVNMVIAAFFTSLVARIYAQLAGRDTPGVFS